MPSPGGWPYGGTLYRWMKLGSPPKIPVEHALGSPAVVDLIGSSLRVGFVEEVLAGEMRRWLSEYPSVMYCGSGPKRGGCYHYQFTSYSVITQKLL